MKLKKINLLLALCLLAAPMRGGYYYAGAAAAGGPDVWYDSVASGSTNTDDPAPHEGGGGGPVGARITPVASGTCTKVRVFLHYDNNAGTIKVALFDTSGNLLGSGTTTASGGAVEVNTFYEVTLGTPVAVTSSTPYIVGYMTSGAATVAGRSLSGQASGTGVLEFSTAYAAFPVDPGPWVNVTQQYCVGMYVD